MAQSREGWAEEIQVQGPGLQVLSGTRYLCCNKAFCWADAALPSRPLHRTAFICCKCTQAPILVSLSSYYRGLSYSYRNKLLLPDLNSKTDRVFIPQSSQLGVHIFLPQTVWNVSNDTIFPFSITEIAKCRDQISRVSYLSSMVVNISVLRINVSSHVEVLGGEHRLLLLHVHAAPFDQSVGSQLQNTARETSATPVFLHISGFITLTVNFSFD